MNIISIPALGITGSKVTVTGKKLSISTEKIHNIPSYLLRHGNIFAAIFNGADTSVKIERNFIGLLTVSFS